MYITLNLQFWSCDCLIEYIFFYQPGILAKNQHFFVLYSCFDIGLIIDMYTL